MHYYSVNEGCNCQNDYRAKLLIEHLASKSFSKVCILHRGEKIKLSGGHVYFLLSGRVSVAFNKSEKIIEHVFNFMPIGLFNFEFSGSNLEYNVLSHVEVLRVEISEVEAIYKTGNSELIHGLMFLTSKILFSLLNGFNNRYTGSKYEMAKSLIEKYHDDSQCERVSSYILNRTHLSRSYVFKVLSHLEKNGVVVIERGRLVSLDKKKLKASRLNNSKN